MSGLLPVWATNLLLVGAACYLAATFHEGSHWVVARFWSNDVKTTRMFRVVPRAVNLRSPYDVPPHEIRLSAMAPQLICLPLFLAVFVILEGHFILRLAVTFPLWVAVLMISSLDILAILYPRRFQEHADSNEDVGHIKGIKLIIGELRSPR